MEAEMLHGIASHMATAKIATFKIRVPLTGDICSSILSVIFLMSLPFYSCLSNENANVDNIPEL